MQPALQPTEHTINYQNIAGFTNRIGVSKITIYILKIRSSLFHQKYTGYTQPITRIQILESIQRIGFPKIKFTLRVQKVSQLAKQVQKYGPYQLSKIYIAATKQYSIQSPKVDMKKSNS